MIAVTYTAETLFAERLGRTSGGDGGSGDRDAETASPLSGADRSDSRSGDVSTDLSSARSVTHPLEGPPVWMDETHDGLPLLR